MGIAHRLYRLELQDDLVLDDYVRSETLVEPNSTIFDGNGNLTLHYQATLAQHIC